MKTKVYVYMAVFAVVLVLLSLNSCYSVRLQNVEGAPNKQAIPSGDGPLRGLEVIELDTVITIGPLNKDFTYLIKVTDLCPSGKLHTVEYRNTLGAVLLSGITFGRKRKVKVKYVCLK